MKNVTCKNCGVSISKEAESCPQCGHPNKKNKNLPPSFTLSVLGIFIAFIIYGFMSVDDGKNPNSTVASSTNDVKGTSQVQTKIDSTQSNKHSTKTESSSKTIYEWADALRGTTRESVVNMLGKPDYASEGQKIAGGAVRFIQYVYNSRVEDEHTAKLSDLYVTFDWNNTREISVGSSGKKIDLMF